MRRKRSVRENMASRYATVESASNSASRAPVTLLQSTRSRERALTSRTPRRSSPTNLSRVSLNPRLLSWVGFKLRFRMIERVQDRVWAFLRTLHPLLNPGIEHKEGHHCCNVLRAGATGRTRVYMFTTRPGNESGGVKLRLA